MVFLPLRMWVGWRYANLYKGEGVGSAYRMPRKNGQSRPLSQASNQNTGTLPGANNIEHITPSKSNSIVPHNTLAANTQHASPVHINTPISAHPKTSTKGKSVMPYKNTSITILTDIEGVSVREKELIQKHQSVQKSLSSSIDKYNAIVKNQKDKLYEDISNQKIKLAEQRKSISDIKQQIASAETSNTNSLNEYKNQLKKKCEKQEGDLKTSRETLAKEQECVTKLEKTVEELNSQIRGLNGENKTDFEKEEEFEQKIKSNFGVLKLTTSDLEAEMFKHVQATTVLKVTTAS